MVYLLGITLSRFMPENLLILTEGIMFIKRAFCKAEFSPYTQQRVIHVSVDSLSPLTPE
jgi:hypothetical protein